MGMNADAGLAANDDRNSWSTISARPAAAGGARLLTSRLAGTLAPPVARVLRLTLRAQPRSAKQDTTRLAANAGANNCAHLVGRGEATVEIEDDRFQPE